MGLNSFQLEYYKQTVVFYDIIQIKQTEFA